MKQLLQITIPGEPMAKLRPQSTPFSPRPYTPATTVNFESRVAWFAVQMLPPDWQPLSRDVPLCVYIEAIHKRPKRLCRKKDSVERVPKVTKPDADNLEKAVLDGLNHAGIWHDDAQVTDLMIEKRYAAILTRKPLVTEPPKTVVIVYRLLE
jgi:Holliday junction resolvase RusA-like endonuclease